MTLKSLHDPKYLTSLDILASVYYGRRGHGGLVASSVVSHRPQYSSVQALNPKPHRFTDSGLGVASKCLAILPGFWGEGDRPSFVFALPAGQ